MMMPGTPRLSVRLEDVMTTLQKIGEQPFTTDSLVPIMLKSADGWDQVAAFVALTKLLIQPPPLCYRNSNNVQSILR